MATVNFSVPTQVKESFNRAFEGENKSAIIARLMLQNTVRDAKGRHGTILRDVPPDLLQVLDRFLRPLQSHDGGGSSVSVPQLSSQAATSL